jgi:alkanesulfonate monooxygenase SsuD/methylene tetrahydromethanopterin reductase-like flavin-dependent oxidoreductase (luciferase family)
MRLSLCLDPGRSWAQLLTLARRADSGGWHAVYVCDHFMPYDPAGQPADGPMLEGWTVLVALATRTTSVRVGNLVLGNTYRHPAVLANMAATLDLICSGRLVLGIGAGWQANEHTAYGIELPEPRERVAALGEACAVLRGLLDQPRTTLAGSFYQLRDAPCDPKPAARVPLLVGGSGPGTMRVAARHADAWHTWAGPAEFARKNALLDRFCREYGREPGDLARACGGTVTVRSGPAGSGIEPRASDGDLAGSPAEILAQLRAFAEAGADEYVVSDDARVPVDQALEHLDALTDSVLPSLRAG